MSSSKVRATQSNVGGEGLLAAGVVHLFGRPFTGLQMGDIALPATANHQLATSMRMAEAEGRDLGLARIYGFSHLGSYRKLPEPQIFLVFAPGVPVPPGVHEPDAPDGLIGLDAGGEASSAGVLMWTCDQLDMALRIDVRIGWLKELLLNEADADALTGVDARRADIVGRDANLVGRAANLIGRDR